MVGLLLVPPTPVPSFDGVGTTSPLLGRVGSGVWLARYQ